MPGLCWGQSGSDAAPVLTHRALSLVGNPDKHKWAIATQTGYIYEGASTPAWKVAVKKVFFEGVAT